MKATMETSMGTITLELDEAKAPATVANFGSRGLIFTLPFVTLGLMRYLRLVRRRDEGERPERTLLTDPPLLATILLFGLAVALVFRFRVFLP